MQSEDGFVSIPVEEFERLHALIRSMARDLDIENGWDSSTIAKRSLPRSTDLYEQIFGVRPHVRDEQRGLV